MGDVVVGDGVIGGGAICTWQKGSIPVLSKVVTTDNDIG